MQWLNQLAAQTANQLTKEAWVGAAMSSLGQGLARFGGPLLTRFGGAAAMFGPRVNTVAEGLGRTDWNSVQNSLNNGAFTDPYGQAWARFGPSLMEPERQRLPAGGQTGGVAGQMGNPRQPRPAPTIGGKQPPSSAPAVAPEPQAGPPPSSLLAAGPSPTEFSPKK